MRKRKIILIVFFCAALLWVGAILHANILTMLFGYQFSDLDTVGFNCMHPWEDDPKLRILYYSPTKAKVYYFSDMGGEKALFVKQEGVWKYSQTLSMWSDYGGTADTYFVWPYYKNFVV